MSIILTIALVIFADALTTVIVDIKRRKEHRRKMNELFKNRKL